MSRYNSSIHFCPDLVLNQIAKLVPIIAAIDSNNANASISFSLCRLVSNAKEYAIDCQPISCQALC